MKAGPLSDPGIVRLIDRHFVSNFFNSNFLGQPNPQGLDAAGLAFVTRFNPTLRMEGSSLANPPVLIFAPDGELLAQINNYAPTGEFLEAIRAVLARHPEYVQSDPERAELEARLAASPDDADLRCTIARRAFEWADHEVAAGHADRLIEDDPEDLGALYLRARIACAAGEWSEANVILGDLYFSEDPDAPRVMSAIRIDLVRGMIARKDYASLTSLVERARRQKDLDENQRRALDYYLGLARYHTGDLAGAQALWNPLQTDYRNDAWSAKARQAMTSSPLLNPEVNGPTSAAYAGSYMNEKWYVLED